MIKETMENLYHFIVSQLPRKYDYRLQRTRFDDAGIPLYTALLINKGPRHYLIVSYDHPVEEFEISLRKPQGTINEITIHKYA